MNIVEMREKRANLWKSMEAFLETRRDSNGCLSAEDDATYARMEADLQNMTNEIHRLERRDAMEAELSKPVNTPIQEKPQNATGIDTKIPLPY